MKSLQQAYALSLETPADTGAPPVDMDRILDALEGRLEPADVGELVDLTIAHPTWAAAWSEAKHMHATRELVAPRPANNTRWFVAGGTLFAAAAALFLVFRSPAPAPVYRGNASHLISQSAEITRAEPVLSWTGVAPDSRVRVRIFDSTLAPLVQHGAMGLERYVVPTGLLPDDQILWRLEVTTADGQVERSSTFRTRVKHP